MNWELFLRSEITNGFEIAAAPVVVVIGGIGHVLTVIHRRVCLNKLKCSCSILGVCVCVNILLAIVWSKQNNFWAKQFSWNFNSN